MKLKFFVFIKYLFFTCPNIFFIARWHGHFIYNVQNAPLAAEARQKDINLLSRDYTVCLDNFAKNYSATNCEKDTVGQNS